MGSYLSETLTVEGMLSDPFFYEVPAFQRLYSWTKLEAGRLLDHLIRAVGSDADGDDCPGHFLCSILLLDTSPEPKWFRGGKPSSGSPRLFSIVDGQQRLVTLIILFCVLRDLDSSADKSLANRLEKIIFRSDEPEQTRLKPLERDTEFFNRYIATPGACKLDPPLKDRSQSEMKLLEVRDLILERLEDMDNQQRARLAEVVLMDCEASVIAARSIDKAHEIFSTLNGTGLKLSRSDIIKVEVLGQISKDDPAEGKYCLEQWDKARDMLDKENQFEDLFSHIHTVYGRSDKNIISTTRAVVAKLGPRAFIDTVLTPLAEAYYAILNPGHGHRDIIGTAAPDDTMVKCLISLSWLASADWVPPAMTFIAANLGKPEEIARFIIELERFTYCLRILGIGGEKRLARFAALVAGINNKERLDRNHEAFKIDRTDRHRIGTNLRALYRRNNQQICKAVLMRLSMDIAGKVEGLDAADLTVEHVHPRNPKADSIWYQWYGDDKSRKDFVCCLGNLVLLPKDKNGIAANGEFSHKLDAYFSPDEDGNPPRLAAITRRIEGISEWREKQVIEMEADLLERVNRLWRLNEKSRLLLADA